MFNVDKERLIEANAVVPQGQVRITPKNVHSAIRYSMSDDCEGFMESVQQEVLGAIAPLPQAVRERVLRPLREDLENQMDKLKADERWTTRKLEAYQAAKVWLESNPIPILEKNDTSRLHSLQDAGAANMILDGEGLALPKQGTVAMYQNTLVISHDWAAAFKNAQGMDGEVRLPYPLCAFEFRVGGKTIIALVIDQDGDIRQFAAIVHIGEFWFGLGGGKLASNSESAYLEFIRLQVRAICIALDAEVATTTVQRAPYQLNAKREKTGKTKLADFHVVNLARRHRIANPSAGSGGEVGRKRLHFRRGHWRHFETSKTWVKWCLVGNPDLGFIAKQYKL